MGRPHKAWGEGDGPSCAGLRPVTGVQMGAGAAWEVAPLSGQGAPAQGRRTQAREPRNWCWLGPGRVPRELGFSPEREVLQGHWEEEGPRVGLGQVVDVCPRWGWLGGAGAQEQARREGVWGPGQAGWLERPWGELIPGSRGQ